MMGTTNINSLKKLSLILLLVGFFLYFLFNIPLDYNYESLINYYTVLAAYVVFILLVLLVMKFEIIIFEPATMVLSLYYMIFIFRPLTDLLNNDLNTSSGYYIGDGCIKGTILFIVGLIFFLIGYFNKRHKMNNFTTVNYIETIAKYKQNSVYRCALMIWSISFLLSMVYFVGSGYGITYIFSVGTLGTADINSRSSLMIFSTFKSCLVSTWLYIYIFGKNRLVKLITFILGVNLFLSMGGRALALVYCLTPVVYYYVSKKKSPSISCMGVLLFFIVSLSVIVEATRTGIRTGQGFIMPELTLSLIMSPFDHELTTYKAFYAVVNTIPDSYSYLFGEGMILYTLIMFIPRVLWPDKPNPPIYDVIEHSMGSNSVIGGAVYPNIGEFYVEFGIVGVVLFMYAFGCLLRKINAIRLYSNASSHGLILYSALFTIMLQVTIRGYTPSNFYQVILTILPVIIIKYLTRGENFNIYKNET